MMSADESSGLCMFDPETGAPYVPSVTDTFGADLRRGNPDWSVRVSP
tara:strand:- start:32 stop:172 length:141 start_codon:yes stop_codon:yes gene_type:complete